MSEDSPTKMTPEIANSPDKPPLKDRLQVWSQSVARSIKEGKAFAGVEARTNFTVRQKGEPVSLEGDPDGGYKFVFIRQGEKKDIPVDKAKDLTYFFAAPVEEKLTQKTGDDVLTIAILDPNHLAQEKRQKTRLEEFKNLFGEDKRIIALYYRQSKADRSGRIGSKGVFLVVPEGQANELEDLIKQSTPQEAHTAVIEAFALSSDNPEETRQYFDAAILEKTEGDIKVQIKPKTQLRAMEVFKSREGGIPENKDKWSITSEAPKSAQEITTPVPQSSDTQPLDTPKDSGSEDKKGEPISPPEDIQPSPPSVEPPTNITPPTPEGNDPDNKKWTPDGPKLDFIKPKETQPQMSANIEEQVAKGVVKAIEETGLSEAQQKQVEMMKEARGSYTGFVQMERSQIYVNPYEWQKEAENNPWFNNLSDEQKDAILHRTMWNFMAGKKFAGGMFDLDSCLKPGKVKDGDPIPINLSRESMDHLWFNMPGYRIMEATMLHNLFTLSGKNPSVPNEYQERERHLVLTEEGLAKLKDFANFRKNLVNSLAEAFKQKPELFVGDPLFTSVTPEVAANAAFSAAWNKIFASGVIDSADEGRKFLTGPQLSSSALRAFFMPRDQAHFKMGYKIEKEAVVVGDIQEGWGGDIGNWYLDRIKNSPDFLKKTLRGEVNYIPPRLMFCWYDFTEFSEGKHKQASLAQGLMLEETKKIGNGLLDFVNPHNARPNNLKDDELWWRYSGTADSARKVYELITGQAKKEDYTVETFADSIVSVQVQMPWIKHVYMDEDLQTAAVAMLAQLEAQKNGIQGHGFLLGTDELILNMNSSDQDNLVNHVLWTLNSRIYENQPDLRKKILKRLGVNDLYSFTGAELQVLESAFSGIPVLRNFFKRTKERIKAEREKKERVK